jgi:hypothetical protein
MKRTPQQLAALAKSKEDQVAQTRKNIESALERMRLAKSKNCDGKITIANLCIESGVSKQTIYRYPEYLEKLKKIKRLVDKKTGSPENIYEKNRELNRIILKIKQEKVELQKKYDNLEKRAKQEIMILNNKIVSLQRSNSKKDSNVISLKK